MADPVRDTFSEAVSKNWKRIVFIQHRVLMDNELNEFQDLNIYERKRLFDSLHIDPDNPVQMAIVSGLTPSLQGSVLTVAAGKVAVFGILKRGGRYTQKL